MFKQLSFTRTLVLTLLLALSASLASAQTTKFTYQGVLNDNQSPANGTYDFEFRLFNALSGGAQQGATVTANDVVVSNGQFTVTLDFGAAAFPGADRYLEIGVRAGASVGAYTLLAPRQQLNSTPYAIQSLNAASATNALQLGGTAANQYVLTGDARLSDARNPLPNSTNYIQNTTTQQANSNFRISGNGIAGGTLSGNIVNATAQYNLNGTRILSNAGFRNLFAGEEAGFSNPTGGSNSFFGAEAGRSFLTGDGNSFFGRQTGGNLTTGTNNIFIGNNAGASHTTGSWNIVVGANASVVGPGLTYATAIGADATVETSHTIVLGTAGETVRVPGNLSVTGALTASGAALSNLNANNITTGILAVARGGTGMGTPGAAGNYLRSNGTSWTSSALQAGDLPSGSTDYIQNRTTQQTSANFNISGNGIIGGNVGIGTPSPATKLHVVGSDNDGTTATLKITSGSQTMLLDGNEIDALVDALNLNHNSNLNVLLANGGGNVGIGTTNPVAKLDVNGTTRTEILQIIGGSDLSEKFEVNAAKVAGNHHSMTLIQAGMVVSIDTENPGELVLSNHLYDRKVVGIISGAGGVKPGMIMGQSGSIADGKHPVALTGRVYCWADATDEPIEPGDLLTTSSTPGHAMKALDHQKAQGAVIGKAMTSLKEGKGLVLVLVSLQ